MPGKDKILARILSLCLARDKTGTAGATTLSAAAVAGATTLTVTAITNFAAGDVIRVGAGEQMEMVRIDPGTAPSGGTITLEPGSPLLYAHASGDPVREQTVFDLGDVTDGGVSLPFAGEVKDQLVATKRLLFTRLNGYLDLNGQFSLPAPTLENLCHATGSLLANIVGAGSASDWKQLTVDGSEFAVEQNMSLIIQAVLLDQTNVQIQLWGVDMDYTGIDFPLQRGELSAVPVKILSAAGGFMGSVLPTWTADVSIKPTKGDVFDELTEVGIFVAGGTGGSTVASGGVAGTNTVTLVSATGYAAGDWVKYGTGETVEFHQIDSVATNTLTNRTRFKRNQAVGTVSAEQIQQPFGGVDTDGGRLKIGGNVQVLRSGVNRMSIGIRPGNVTIALGFNILGIRQSDLAYALGIAQSQIANNRLPLNNNIGRTTIDGVYVKGTLQNAKICEVQSWGNVLDISQINLLLNSTGKETSVPFTAFPTSALNIVQHA